MVNLWICEKKKKEIQSNKMEVHDSHMIVTWGHLDQWESGRTFCGQSVPADVLRLSSRGRSMRLVKTDRQGGSLCFQLYLVETDRHSGSLCFQLYLVKIDKNGSLCIQLYLMETDNSGSLCLQLSKNTACNWLQWMTRYAAWEMSMYSCRRRKSNCTSKIWPVSSWISTEEQQQKQIYIKIS